LTTNNNRNNNHTASSSQHITNVSNLINPSDCCDIPDHIQAKAISNPHPTSKDIMIWETGLIGFKIRPWVPIDKKIPETSLTSKTEPISPQNRPSPSPSLSSSSLNNSGNSTDWMVATLAGVRGFPSYWTGRFLNPKPRKPVFADPHFMAQSAGWMASAREIMEYQSDLCEQNTPPKIKRQQSQVGKSGSFLPPYDAPLFLQDGMWRNSVEFWSGGIQLWGSMCQIQRVINLDDNDFSKHLVYHASNNKQHRKSQDQLVLAETLFNELKLVKAHVEYEYQFG
jgi:hypothetical protein